MNAKFNDGSFLNNESNNYFLGATTRRKLLENADDNEIKHPSEDEPVFQEDLKEISFEKKKKITFQLPETLKFEKDFRKSKTIRKYEIEKKLEIDEFGNFEIRKSKIQVANFENEVVNFEFEAEKSEIGKLEDEFMKFERGNSKKLQKNRSEILWKTNFFVIVYLVSLFLSKIKNASRVYLRRKLMNKHYCIVDDKSYFPVPTTLNQKTVEIMRNQNYFLNNLRRIRVFEFFFYFFF